MDSQPFWNPKIETLPREDLQALQLEKLRRTAEWADARSPFYRRTFAAAGFRPEQLKSWDDIQRIPFLEREAWMASQDAHPPFGELPVTGSDNTDNAIRLHTTSGTSGRTPLRALDSRKDWSWAAEMWCYGLWGAGVRPGDRAYVAFGYGTFIGFWGLHYGLEKMGALTLPGGAQNTAGRVKQIIDFGVTVVASTTTYALRLAQEAEALGLDLKNSPVHTVILSGEPTPPITRDLIERQWGAKAYDTAGMTELGTIFMFEPQEQPGGTHIIEGHFIEQVVDPDTGEELPYGEPGERVTTSFGRGTLPILRYRTKDLVVKVPHTVASSGRTWDLYEGGILGRVDDMKLIRGTNVYPRAVEEIVRKFELIDEFHTYIERVGIRDEVTVHVEPVTAMDDAAWPGLEEALKLELAEAHEGLNFHVSRREAGALPRFELKAKRMTDMRPANR
ncbi:phenylacetate--CoA ligase family protein [Microbacterium sp. ZXX196]|uniref:phenylacetate--CoA ligase family protein n=1 Tax=Microbacterium sp. ZXX196 TaxID=2609291 RepID=UPI0012B83C7F|nr:AMP-binding protein [Microbacterium sp. ZXX196]MTE24223.1 AMP-binding protein [Microbacterium sp. ZXX196]